MITILPADKAFLDSIAAPEGVDAMVLRDSDGTVFGHALFSVTGDTVEVLAVETAMPIMAEGLIRSVLNTGDCRGATVGICRDESLAPLLRHLEFEQKDGFFAVSIQAFLYGDCHCG